MTTKMKVLERDLNETKRREDQAKIACALCDSDDELRSRTASLLTSIQEERQRLELLFQKEAAKILEQPMVAEVSDWHEHFGNIYVHLRTSDPEFWKWLQQNHADDPKVQALQKLDEGSPKKMPLPEHRDAREWEARPGIMLRCDFCDKFSRDRWAFGLRESYDKYTVSCADCKLKICA
jgi:hypothetical protein